MVKKFRPTLILSTDFSSFPWSCTFVHHWAGTSFTFRGQPWRNLAAMLFQIGHGFAMIVKEFRIFHVIFPYPVLPIGLFFVKPVVGSAFRGIVPLCKEISNVAAHRYIVTPVEIKACGSYQLFWDVYHKLIPLGCISQGS